MERIIMTRTELMQSLGVSGDEVDRLVFTDELPGHALSTHVWSVDPVEWWAYLDERGADLLMPPFNEKERRVWQGYTPNISDTDPENGEGEAHG